MFISKEQWLIDPAIISTETLLNKPEPDEKYLIRKVVGEILNKHENIAARFANWVTGKGELSIFNTQGITDFRSTYQHQLEHAIIDSFKEYLILSRFKNRVGLINGLRALAKLYDSIYWASFLDNDIVQLRRELTTSPSLIEYAEFDIKKLIKLIGTEYNPGISARVAFEPFVQVILATDNFIHADKVVNFLKGMFRYTVTPKGLEYFAIKRDGLEWLDDVSHYLGLDINRINDAAYLKVHRIYIVEQLYIAYFGQYKQWIDKATSVTMDDGSVIRIHHHSLISDVFTDNLYYHAKHPRYPNQLPFGIHPNDYYRELIIKLANEIHESVKETKYPTDFKAYIDNNASIRQLTTGLELYNEGLEMSHCVGGEGYQNQMRKGSTLFFHIDAPDKSGKGYTVSLVSAKPYELYRRTVYYSLNDTHWVIDASYGYGNQNLDDDEMSYIDETLLTNGFSRVYLGGDQDDAPYPDVTNPYEANMGVNIDLAGTYPTGSTLTTHYRDLSRHPEIRANNRHKTQFSEWYPMPVPGFTFNKLFIFSMFLLNGRPILRRTFWDTSLSYPWKDLVAPKTLEDQIEECFTKQALKEYAKSDLGFLNSIYDLNYKRIKP